MAKILAEGLSETALVAAIEDNAADLYRAFLPRLPHAEVHDDLDVFHGSSAIPTPLCNAIACARFPAAGANERIDAVLARFRRRRLPVTWWTGPMTTPADLGRRLERRGFRLASDMAGMAVDLDSLPDESPPAPGLSAERVADGRTLAAWMHAFTSGFRISPAAAMALEQAFGEIGFEDDAPCRHYLGRSIGNGPGASATLVRGAEAAGLYNITTIAPLRRRGLGAAVTLAALHDARTLGYRYAVLHATASGAELYRTLGFVERCRIRTYVRT